MMQSRFRCFSILFAMMLALAPSIVGAQEKPKQHHASHGKAAKIEKYFELVFKPGYELLSEQTGKSLESERNRAFATKCPEMKAFMEHKQAQLQAFARDVLEKAKPELLQRMDGVFGERELDAFLAFAETRDGRAYLKRFHASHAAETEMRGYAAFKNSPALRSFASQQRLMLDNPLQLKMDDATSDRLNAILGNMETDMTNKIEQCQRALESKSPAGHL